MTWWTWSRERFPLGRSEERRVSCGAPIPFKAVGDFLSLTPPLSLSTLSLSLLIIIRPLFVFPPLFSFLSVDFRRIGHLRKWVLVNDHVEEEFSGNCDLGSPIFVEISGCGAPFSDVS